jgi:hypothetical protein
MKTPKSIQIEIFDHPDELITKAKETAQKYGVHFLGDNDQGVIRGFGFKADYLFQENVLTITVFRKPAFLPWTTVEEKVRALVNMDPG